MRPAKLLFLTWLCTPLLVLGLLSPALAKDEIKMGMISPLTGTNAQVGQDMERGVRLAIDRLNEGYKVPLKDGKFMEVGPGLLGKKIKLIVENTESRPKAAMDAVRKLINVDKVPAILGEFSSGVSVPTGQFTNSNQVIQISIGSTSPKVRDVGPFMFNSIGLDDLMGKKLTRFAVEDSGAKKFGSIAPNNPFGVGIEINSCKALEEEFGGECVSKVRYKMKQSDYRAEIRSLFATKPEAIFYTAYGTEARLILRQAFEQGKQPPKGWYADYITMWTNEVSEMPEVADGIKGLMPGASGKFYQEQYAKPYEEKYDRPPSTSFGAYGYDAAMLVALAIHEAGSDDAQAIQKAMFTVSETYNGVTGDKTFDDTGMQATETYMRKIYKDGKLQDYSMN